MELDRRGVAARTAATNGARCKGGATETEQVSHCPVSASLIVLPSMSVTDPSDAKQVSIAAASHRVQFGATTPPVSVRPENPNKKRRRRMPSVNGFAVPSPSKSRTIGPAKRCAKSCSV